MRSVHNYINVNKHQRNNCKQFNTSSEWFDGVEYVDLHCDGFKLTITKCYMEIPHTAVKCSLSNKKAFTMQFCKSIELPLGRLYFDEEESTEDELVIYYELQR